LSALEQQKHDESIAREQQLIAMRTNGAANVEESIAFERKAQAEALAEQEKIARRKQRLELITASINMFNNQVQRGNGNALGGTIADVTTLVGFLNSLPAFWDGTETTVGDKLGSKFSDGRDGILARVDKDEIILNKEKSDKLRGMSTDAITKGALMYKFGQFYTSTMTNGIKIQEDHSLTEMRKMNAHLETIAKKPSKTLGIEEVAGITKLTEKVYKNRSIITKTKHIRPGRG